MINIDKFEKALEYCTACPKLCHFACPASHAAAREAATPWGKMSILNLLRKGHLELTYESAEPLYHCMACGLCTVFCEHNIDVGLILTEGRAWLEAHGITHPGYTALKENFTAHGYTANSDLNAVLHTNLRPELLNPEAEVVYIPGTRAIAERPQEIATTFKIFDILGIDFIACAPAGICSGHELWRAGLSADFAAHAARTAEHLLGKRLIICADSEDLFCFDQVYPQLGHPLSERTRHISEFLLPYIANRNELKRCELSRLEQESSYLTRHLGRATAARRILAMIFSGEPKKSGYDTTAVYPCGNEAAYAFACPENSRKVADERMQQIRLSGADIIVATDAASAVALDECKQSGKTGPQTFIEILYRSLEDSND